jgi:protein-cysteine N-palmitoyltransferase HHAT
MLNYLKHESNYLMLKNIVSQHEHEINEFLVIFAWFILKNVSYCLERIESLDERHDNYKLMSFLGYAFYLPTLITGPHVLFSRYCKMLDAKQNDQLMSRMKKFLTSLIRLSMWFFITEFALHFFYMHTIVSSANIRILNTLTFFGVGYLLGQFFNNKYVIHYGVPIAFGQFDGISMPNQPKCICRIHRYSDMWKWFDHGLYEFLFRYIYTELCTKSSTISKKLFAGFVTFFFVYFWHGFFNSILTWSVMNCLCIVIEKFVYNIIESESFIRRFYSRNLYLRIHALIGSQILIPAILSNFFFFGGMELGIEFIRRTYFHGLWNYLNISICVWFLYPVAEAIKRWENKKKY